MSESSRDHPTRVGFLPPIYRVEYDLSTPLKYGNADRCELSALTAVLGGNRFGRTP